MSHVTANGEAVASGTIRLPRVGAWHADLVVVRASAEAISGRVEIRVGENVRLVGTARRSGEARGVVHVRVVGGAGGLAKELEPRAYQGAPLRLPLQDLATETGEALSPASSAAALGIVLPYWARPRGPAGRALAALLASAPDATWRILPDGALWIGLEAWPTSALEQLEYSVVSEAPQAGSVEIATLDPRIFPGELLGGRRVSVVEHSFSAGRIRTTLQLEDEAVGLLDRVKGALAAYVRTLFARIDYFAGYWCRVVAQNADGSLELEPDDTRLPGLSNVPVRYGVPGVQTSVLAGARVLLEFAAGDPSKPFATAWEAARPTEIVVGTGTTQPAAMATALRTELDAIWAAIYGGHVHPYAWTDPAGSAVTSPAAGAASRQVIASEVVKLAETAPT